MAVVVRTDPTVDIRNGRRVGRVVKEGHVHAGRPAAIDPLLPSGTCSGTRSIK